MILRPGVERSGRKTVAGRDQSARSGAVWGYGLAILCAALAVAATESRNPLFPTPLFFAAIVISTWYGGTIPGLVAVGLATIAPDYFFIPPARSLALAKPQMPYIFEFAFPALLTCWFVRRRKIAESTLRMAHDELQSRVEERQAELARVWRMMAAGEMGVSIAHEVNQPLMAVVLKARLRPGHNDEQPRHYLRRRRWTQAGHGGGDRGCVAFLLDGRIPLQLVLDATITGSQDGVAEARILAYDFRTRR